MNITDFHFSCHLNSEKVYEMMHSNHWLHLPRSLEHLNAAKQQSSCDKGMLDAKTATTDGKCPRASPHDYAESLGVGWRASDQSPVTQYRQQQRKRKWGTAGKPRLAQLTTESTSPGMGYLQRKSAFWSGFLRPWKQGKETKPARTKSKREIYGKE